VVKPKDPASAVKKYVDRPKPKVKAAGVVKKAGS
jgi:hypothetical protein